MSGNSHQRRKWQRSAERRYKETQARDMLFLDKLEADLVLSRKDLDAMWGACERAAKKYSDNVETKAEGAPTE